MLSPGVLQSRAAQGTPGATALQSMAPQGVQSMAAPAQQFGGPSTAMPMAALPQHMPQSGAPVPAPQMSPQVQDQIASALQGQQGPQSPPMAAGQPQGGVRQLGGLAGAFQAIARAHQPGAMPPQAQGVPQNGIPPQAQGSPQNPFGPPGNPFQQFMSRMMARHNQGG